MAGTPTWVLDVLACVRDDCRGRLAVVPGGASRGGRLMSGQLGCTRCRTPYPVIGGVPLLLPRPDHWVASYRESILAALAEHGLASRAAVAAVQACAERAPHAEPLRFGDDWTAAEGAALRRGWPQPEGSSAAAEFAAFLRTAAGASPDQHLLSLLPDRLDTALEIGCGAGTLARPLRARAERLVLADLSLRAVLRSLAAARRVRGGEIAGAVIDAEHLRLRRGAVRTAVAAEVVDLLEQPGLFLDELAAGIPRGGRAVFATPAPDLGDADAGADLFAHAVAASGFRVEAELDGIPWVRAHSARNYQVYFVRALLARR